MSDYSWVPGSPFHGDAEAIGAELERLHRDGGLTPEAVVASAKAKRSPLHKLIYDDTTPDEALDKYRLARANVLIKSVQVVIDEGASETVTVRGFHRVVIGPGERVWVPAEVAAADADFSDQVRLRLVREMRGLKKQLDFWNAYPTVATALEEALAA